MALCIICKAAPPDPEKPEHILLNALGGREKTTKALCSRCNNAFGSGADKDLADSVIFLRNIANLKSGTRNSPPIMRSINSEGRIFDLKPGGNPVIKPSKPPLSLKVGEKIKIEIHARDGNQIKELIEAVAKTREIKKLFEDAAIKRGLEVPSTKKFVSHVLENGQAEQRFYRCPPVNEKFVFGPGKSKQSMAKACLVLWNELVGNEEVCNSRYDLLRSFIRSEEDSSSDNYASLYKEDYREVSDYDKIFESHPSIIWVGSNESGRVLGYFRLYNIAGYRFELSQKDASPNRSICLVSNPFNTSIRKVYFQKSDFGEISFEWLERLDRELELNPENVTRSLQRFLSRANDKNRDSIFDKAWDEADIPEGEYLTDDQVKILSERIAIRLIPYLTGELVTVPLKIK